MTLKAVPAPPAPTFELEHNADGTVIVKLREPFRFKGEMLQRLTIPRLTGRHMRLAPWAVGETFTVGEIAEFAAKVIEPAGAFDELDAIVAKDVCLEVIFAMGKHRRTGEPPSPA